MKRPSAITKALPYDEVAAFSHALKQNDRISMSVKLAVEFLILTAARTSEVIGAQWSEIDRAARCWTIPASRGKVGCAHRVPLSARALTVLDEAAQIRESEFVFPAPLSSRAFLTALRLMQRADIAGHGFRSAFREWVLERTSTPTSAAEAALGHTGTDTTQAYRCGDQFEQRIPLMEAWAAHCAAKPVGEAIDKARNDDGFSSHHGTSRCGHPARRLSRWRGYRRRAAVRSASKAGRRSLAPPYTGWARPRECCYPERESFRGTPFL